jgi:hypothetical protein
MMESKWISCKERQPEASGTYLTVDMDSEFPFMRTLDYSAKWHGWNCVESRSIDDEQKAKEWELNVTHWMALPDLPEVDV